MVMPLSNAICGSCPRRFRGCAYSHYTADGDGLQAEFSNRRGGMGPSHKNDFPYCIAPAAFV